MNKLTEYALIGLVAVVGYFFVSRHFMEEGRQEVRAEWAIDTSARHAAESKAIEARRLAVLADSARQAKDKLKLKQDYANEITLVNQQFAATERLRFNHDKLCASGPTAKPEANGTSRSDDSVAGTGLLPEPYNADIKQLMDYADRIVAACRTGQEFIKAEGMAP